MQYVKKFIVGAVACLWLTAVPAAFAAGIAIDPDYKPDNLPQITDDGGSADPSELYSESAVRILVIEKVTNVILGAAGVVAIFSIVFNGWMMVINGGNEDKLGNYKKAIAWSLGGLVLLILSYTIVRFVISVPFQVTEQPAAVEGEGTTNTPDVQSPASPASVPPSSMPQP